MEGVSLMMVITGVVEGKNTLMQFDSKYKYYYVY